MPDSLFSPTPVQPSTGGHSSIVPEDYHKTPDTCDEMIGAGGEVLPHWRKFLKTYNAFTQQEIESLVRSTRHQLRENGVTYNVHGDTAGMSRPWKLDPVPLLVSESDWRVIEEGLRQRAHLLSIILEDLYGPRQLIREGVLPMELVYTHSGFLRACDGIKLPAEQKLIVYAADLCRGPGGRWWVVNDRTQAPSGSGYALENRIVMARALPNLFRDCQVRRLAGFFSDLRDSLAGLAPRATENPRVVVLTPGSRAETYFEHAYLAYYLGYSLVQGDDLTVRDGKVWLKSLDGLQPVDVILRRLDQNFCDPLELRTDSQLGVPGLIESVRRGNVAIANPLGSGVLENPGLMAFLPGIARKLLGEELILPSAATWWCGQKRERAYVLENLEKLVIKKIHREPNFQTLFGNRLSKEEQTELRRQIETEPHLFLGQELVKFSTAPSLAGSKLEPRHAVLRSFLSANGDSYSVMPGGLTRSAPSADSFVVSNQTGGLGKDTWVLGASGESHRSLLPAAQERHRIVIRRSLPSRSAENLFWAGRYSERAEGLARILRAVLRAYFERESSGDEVSNAVLGVLLEALSKVADTLPGFAGPEGEAARRKPDEELRSLIFDRSRPGTLAQCLSALLSSAFGVRDLWSNDSWRVLNAIETHWTTVGKRRHAHVLSLRNEIDDLITSLVAFGGLNMESMTREAGWLLLDTGRRLERALILTDLLRSTLVAPLEEPGSFTIHENVLSITECLATHRSRYRAQSNVEDILELLLTDEIHPRSLLYQVKRIQRNLGFLPRDNTLSRISDEERSILDASTKIQLADLRILASQDAEHRRRVKLGQFLKEIRARLLDVSSSLSRIYFTHVGWRQMVDSQPSPPPIASEPLM